MIFDAIKSDATEWTKITAAKEFFTEDTRAKVLSTIEERYHGRKNDRADSSLDWLLKHRQEIQVIEDTHAETKKLLSLANCLSTIKQIYQEKEKFERRVAAVKEKARLAEKSRNAIKAGVPNAAEEIARFIGKSVVRWMNHFER